MIVVTGATGTVGSATVRRLADAGHKVRALVRNPAKAPTLPGVEVVVADLGKPETLPAAFAGAERAFVLFPTEPELVEYEANAYRAAAEAGARHIVKLSNFAAGVFDTNIWGWHGESENNLRRLGVPWTILRPTRFMSDAPFTWAPIVQNGTVLEPLGDSRLTLVAPDDVAAVAAHVLTTEGHAGEIYSLTSAEALTGARVAEKIAAVLGRPVAVSDMPPRVLHATLVSSGMPAQLADTLLQYISLVQEGAMHQTATTARLLGRAPVSYDEWLRDNAKARYDEAVRQLSA